MIQMAAFDKVEAPLLETSPTATTKAMARGFFRSHARIMLSLYHKTILSLALFFFFYNPASL